MLSARRFHPCWPKICRKSTGCGLQGFDDIIFNQQFFYRTGSAQLNPGLPGKGQEVRVKSGLENPRDQENA